MEENTGHLESQEDESDLKDQFINNSGEEIDISNDDNEKTQEEKIEGDESSKTSVEHDKSSTSRETNSPETSCPICLGGLENKSFTDSCFHTFCFTCLLEWSKVKAECPLCKQTFKSIVHNVRSSKDYDQYFLSSTKSSESYLYSIDGRRFRYQSTMTTERTLERRRRMDLLESLENRIASHRLMFAPHSVRTYTSSEVERVPCNYRSGIYDTDMWVKPHHGSRRQVREISPDFYVDNPACTHRLIPWLNRELVALLHNSESQITFVLELIMALIMRVAIQSQEFYVQLEPYLGHRTGHFIHEFYNFACSPYDMARYDRNAVYTLPHDPINFVNCSSPGSDVISLTDSVSHAPSTSNESRSSRQTKKTKHTNKRLKKLVLKRNHENDSWQSVIPFQASSSSSSLNSPSFINSENTSDYYNIPGPSTSTYQMSYSYDTSIDVSTSYHNNPSTSRNDDNECLIVDEVPPKSHRITEIINLLSSDEENEKGSTKKSTKSLKNVVSLNSSSDGKVNNFNDIITLSSDDSNEDKYSQDIYQVISYSSNESLEVSSVGSDVDEIVQKPAIIKKSEKKIVSSIEDAKTDSNKSTNGHYSLSNPSNVDSKCNEQTAWSLRNSDCNSSSSITPNAIASYSSSITPIAGYESSTDSCSEISSSSHKPKKQKLRSVVAQVSKDHHYERSDSSHHSSHKRHKEKHKKKKKHSHKHRHHSHSYESE